MITTKFIDQSKRNRSMERSSGAVIYRNSRYLLLLYGYGHWGFVKGKREKGESYKETFFREAQEETGLTKNQLKILPGFTEKITYFHKKEGKNIFKEVVYVLAESTTFKVHISSEHESYRWLTYSKALKLISFENDRNVLRKAHDFLENKIVKIST